MTASLSYADLDPQQVLDALDAVGLRGDGRILQLNSYENRVFQLFLEDGRAVVAKFYRPGRWSDAAIAEEHAFAAELATAEIPVVAPLSIGGRSLHASGAHRFAIYPRRGGRAPQLESTEHLQWMGRLIARIHLIGARAGFAARGAIDVDTFLRAPAAAVLASPLLPAPLSSRYRAAIDALEAPLRARFAACPARRLRLHGDCHPGNVLWTDHGPHFVDLDDARLGPAVQDLWMLAPDAYALDRLLEGYAEFRDFDYAELSLIEPLRALRQVHWAGWIAQRWHDPAFPQGFPFVGEARWWEQHISDLVDMALRLGD